MRLAQFIQQNTKPILAQWDLFARQIWPEGAPDPATLRDHAAEILLATARDMATEQTADQQAAKSMGRGEGGAASKRVDAIAAEHAAGRVRSGFALPSLVAEYRALRASVIRLWRASNPTPDPRDLDDLIRFNEAIDQSVFESITSFHRETTQARQMFLGVLGHDLRAPLNSVALSAAVLSRMLPDNPDAADTAAQIASSAAAMGEMLKDLLDFTTTELGVTIPISPAPADLSTLCSEVTAETRAAHPSCTIACHTHGDLRGEWDVNRLRQVLSNLLGNAVQHGGNCGDIRIEARDDGPFVRLDVRNGGPPIPPDVLPTIFDPLVRGVAQPTGERRRRRPGSIGLGLYISREIVLGHGGTIDVASAPDTGTVFTIRLPRHPPPSP
jgi:signal transduction histidine kinase